LRIGAGLQSNDAINGSDGVSGDRQRRVAARLSLPRSAGSSLPRWDWADCSLLLIWKHTFSPSLFRI
jgi:hypothetical protein